MRIIRNTVMAAICLSFIGCTQVIDLEAMRPDPSLVVNCVALTGEPLTASVSRTWFLTEDHPNVTLKKADVRLFVNGTFVSKMVYEDALGEGYNSRGVFRSGYYPKVGDQVRVEVTEPDFGEAWGEAVVPRPANVLSASRNVVLVEQSIWKYQWISTYTVTFCDNASTNDYYLFRLQTGQPLYDKEKEEYTGEYLWGHVYLNYEDEPLFGQSISSIDQILGYDKLSGDGGRVFSDELINGQEYTLRLTATSIGSGKPVLPDTSLTAPNDQLRILLYTVSKGYYQYLKTLHERGDYSLSNLLIDAGLAEPIQVYSNVEGGVGVLGACRRDTFDIEVTR